MPTGYTAAVVDGTLTDFRTFALRCARNFGATIMQRDDSMDVLPKHREVSPFYAESLAKAQAEAERLAHLTPAEAAKAMRAEWDARMAQIKESEQRANDVRRRCEAMLEQAKVWSPPTGDHEDLRNFMIQQLTDTLDFDGRTYLEPHPVLMPDAWLREQQRKAAKDIADYQQHVADEQERCDKSNAWIDALYASLSTVAPLTVPILQPPETK